MARIERVGHTVLYVSDVDRAVAFYHDKLGMEIVRHDRKNGLAFMSFGRQHHDIGLFDVNMRGEATRGTLGLSHLAFVIEGGTEELKELHDDIVGRGVEIIEKMDYGYTRGIYFNDPDGNGLEIYHEDLEDFRSKAWEGQYPRQLEGIPG